MEKLGSTAKDANEHVRHCHENGEVDGNFAPALQRRAGARIAEIHLNEEENGPQECLQ